MTGIHLSAAPFVAVFAILFGIVALSPNTQRGLVVRIGRTAPCMGDDRRDVVVEVLSSGILKINVEEVKREDLEHRLATIFRTRVYRWIWVIGDPDLQFRKVAEVIDACSREVDYVVILPPSLMRQANRANGICIEPDLPRAYWRHPPR